MKRLLKASKFFALSLLAVAALCGFSGCYEGSHLHGSGDHGGGGDNKGGGAGGQKPYGIAIIDVIRPSDAAMANPACGNVPSSLMDLRRSEISARVKNLTSLIDAQADLLRVVVSEITLEECVEYSFTTLESRATTASPDPDISDALKNKLALNVRLVLWYGAGGNTAPSPAVWGNEWADMQRLKDLGFGRRLSVNQFAITGPSFGYLWNWQTASDPANNFTAAVIMDHVPSGQGVQALMTAIKKSAVEFSDWLGQRARSQ